MMDQEIKDGFDAIRGDFKEFKTEVRKGYDKLDTKLERFLLGQNIHDKEIAIIQVNQDTHEKDIQAAHNKIKLTDTNVGILKNQLNKTVFKVGGIVTLIMGLVVTVWKLVS